MNDDKVITMLLDHEERLERIERNMATKTDLNDISDTLDKILGLVQKKDQELTMMTHGMIRQGKQVEQHEKDIAHIKPLVGLT